MELEPWEAPAVVDIDVTTGTWGGCYELFSETIITQGCYRPVS